MDEAFERRTECRVCLARELVEFLDLGEIPPANGFIDTPDVDESSFPLVVSVCENCKHVQLAYTVDRELLFSEYHYFSSRSAPIEDHFERYAEDVEQTYLDDTDDLVVEIGSNDGVLLQFFEGYDRLGIEPAENVAAVAQDRGIPTKTDFFSESVAEETYAEHGAADVIMANNVVGHIDDLQSLMRGVDTLLSDDGTFVIEVPYFVELYNGNEFDTVYHEHISYFSMQSFVALAERHDMVIGDVQRVPVHGGSVRIHMQRSSTAQRAQLVDDLLSLERAMGLDQVETYHSFAAEIEEYRTQIRSLLHELADDDATVVGYGAPAKGNILLNYCDIGTDVIDFIIDTTPAKQGTYTPGTNIPVRPPDALDEADVDYVFLLAWNYRDAILKKEADLRETTPFVIPIPHLDIV